MRVGWRTVLAVALLGLMLAAGVGYAQDGGDPGHGADLYLTYCAMCHGEDGRGRIGANLQDFPGIDAEAAIEQVIREGVPGSVMPAWAISNGGPLSEEDIRDIGSYLIGVLNGTSPVAPAPTYQPPVLPTLVDVEGDPSQGAAVFQSNCTACHGEQAQGGFGWTLAKSWPGNEPQVYLRSVIAAGIEGSIMPAWSQEVGGPLTDQDIADVTAYILTLPPGGGPLPVPTPEQPGPLGVSASLILFAALAVFVVVVLVVYYRRA